MEDGMIVNSRRYKKTRNHRYLQYTQYTPAQTDTVVSDVKKDIELRHDFLLRKFEYSRALDAVLKPFVARKKPEYTYRSVEATLSYFCFYFVSPQFVA